MIILLTNDHSKVGSRLHFLSFVPRGGGAGAGGRGTGTRINPLDKISFSETIWNRNLRVKSDELHVGRRLTPDTAYHV